MSMFNVMSVPLEKVMEVEQKPEPENSIEVYSATIKIIFFFQTLKKDNTNEYKGI